jgi:RNA polymerase sigma-70 factor, ECF subfamily
VNQTLDSECESLEEEQLIEAAKQDPASMSILYRRHYGVIHRYVSHRVATPHDVNDIVSETFLTMVQTLPKYQWTGAPFQAWLFRLASTQIHRWIRKRKWTRFWAPFDDQVVSAQEDSSESDDTRVLRAEMLQLPQTYQDALSLFYMEDMSIASIAQVFQVSEGTIKSRLSRGRELLKTKLMSHQPKERQV